MKDTKEEPSIVAGNDRILGVGVGVGVGVVEGY